MASAGESVAIGGESGVPRNGQRYIVARVPSRKDRAFADLGDEIGWPILA